MRDLASLTTIILFLLIGTGSDDSGAASGSSGGPSYEAPSASSGHQLTVPLSDGSTLTFSRLGQLPDWACGTRKSATFQGGDVVLYFDRSGTLVSANAPATGNQKFYERDPSRSCVKNWVSGDFEMLTDREYKRYERQAQRKPTSRKAKTAQ